jgi:SAM-dependent methyltransferase
MEGSYPSNLHVWKGWTSPVVPDQRAPALSRALPPAYHPADYPDRLYAAEALTPNGAVPRADAGAPPYTLQWFLDIENQRHRRHGRWIPRLLEFAKHSGETLLGLGTGLGTDWLQYARHGAAVVVCSPSADQLDLIRRNFELRGLGGRFLHAVPTHLPLESGTIDVACLTNWLPEVGNPQAVVDEVYRVLKPGGKVLAVTPARYDVGFWFHACFPWYAWLGGRPRGAAAPPVRFSARGLRRLFHRFSEHRVHKRQLRRSEVPHVWRWLPLPVLERLMGRALVLKAFKPLSTAITVPLTA